MKLKFAIALATLGIAATSCGSDSEPISAGGEPTTTTEQPLGGGPYPIATLEFTITHPDTDTVTYTVSCLGDTATVIGNDSIDERAACLQLANDETKARLVEGEPSQRTCTEIYGGPDEAIVAGSFDGAVVNTTINRNNGCGIDDWDRLLTGVLPTALGVTQ